MNADENGQQRHRYERGTKAAHTFSKRRERHNDEDEKQEGVQCFQAAAYPWTFYQILANAQTKCFFERAIR